MRALHRSSLCIVPLCCCLYVELSHQFVLSERLNRPRTQDVRGRQGAPARRAARPIDPSERQGRAGSVERVWRGSRTSWTLCASLRCHCEDDKRSSCSAQFMQFSRSSPHGPAESRNHRGVCCAGILPRNLALFAVVWGIVPLGHVLQE